MNDTTLPPYKSRERQAEYKRRYRSKPETKVKEIEYRRIYNALPEVKARRKPRRRAQYNSEYGANTKEYNRMWRRLNKEKTKAYALKKRQKREDHYARIAGRPKPSVCDLCERKIGNINFDHCHRRGHFRGFLCDRCNRVLGLAEDDIKLLRKMAAYLSRHSEKSPDTYALPLTGLDFSEPAIHVERL